MSDAIELQAVVRTTTGTQAARRLRRLEDTIPGIIYGAEQAPVMINLPQNKLLHALEDEGFYSRILSLDVDGKPVKVVLKALQRHPWKPKILHVDFFRISTKEKLNMSIPLHFIGEDTCPGFKAGGVATHHFNELEIRCLPADLPEFIEVDISALNIGDMLHLTDIKLPKNVEIVALMHGEDDEHNQGVVSVHEPRVTAEPAPGEEGEEAGETPAEGGSQAEGEAK